MRRTNLLAGAASLVLNALGQLQAAPTAEAPVLRSRKKGSAYRSCFNEKRVGDKLTYFHATKGRRTRRVPA